jgi:hypothetical protein
MAPKVIAPGARPGWVEKLSGQPELCKQMTINHVRANARPGSRADVQQNTRTHGRFDHRLSSGELE